MKKISILLASIASIVFLSAPVMAVEGEGTIDEVRVCGAANVGYLNYTYFKLSDGKWFYLRTNFGTNGDYDDNQGYSLVMTAYTSRYKVKVNASFETGNPRNNLCGIVPEAGLNNLNGDYIALKEYSE